MARSCPSTSPGTQALGQIGNNIELNPTTIASNAASNTLTEPTMYSKAALPHSSLHATNWQLEYINYGLLPATHAEPPTSFASEMPSAGTEAMSTSLYERHSTNSSSGTTGIECMLVQTVMNIRHRDEGQVAADGEPPAKRFKNVAGRAIAPPMTHPTNLADLLPLQSRPPLRIDLPPLQSMPPLQIFSIPEIRPLTAPQATRTAPGAYIRGNRYSPGIVKLLHAYQKQMAETGGFDVEELIALLALKGNNFTFGDPERIEFSRALVSLINSTIKRHNKSQGKFDSPTLDRFGLAALEWLSRSARVMRSSELNESYSNGNPDMHDENVIVRPLLRMMCAAPESRDFILRIFEDLDVYAKNQLTITFKIHILRLWAKGEISLNSAEQEALCALKVKNCTSAKGLLALIRKYAGVPVDALVIEDVSRDKPVAGANQ